MWRCTVSRARTITGAARAVARLAKQVEVALTPLDLSLPQYRVLALLGEGSTASSVLARRLAVSPPSVTAVVDGLVGRGLVEREADPEDRRRLTLLLTRDGSKLLAAADAPAAAGPQAPRGRRRGGRSAPRRDRRVLRRRADRPRRLERRARPQPGSATGAGEVTIEMGAFGADVTSPFVPVGVTPEYPPPRAHIKPDRGGSWLRRMMPVVLAHKWMFGFSLVASFVGLAVQVQIPNEVGQAIDSLGKSTGNTLEYFVGIIVVLAVIRFVLTYLSRNYLLKTAYRIEYDLRNIMYEHLSRMSFSFYDRVQSGQLISRANSDIRSVQMYLTFAPSILVQCSAAVLAFAEMLSINVPLALVTMSTMPFVYVVGVRMRKQMFPVSWLIQSRLADVATVVDENINGVRVVKSFAAEDQQLQHLTGAAMRAEWANVKDADIRAKWSPLLENLPRLGQAIVLFYGGYLAINGQASVGDIIAFNAYVLMLQPPFRPPGMLP